MSMISAKGQEHVKIEAKIPEDIDIAFKKYLWLLDMTLDEGIRQAILHYMEYLDKQVEHVKIEAKIPEDIDIAFKKYLWLLDMTLDEGIRQAILHYMEYLDKQVELVKKGKTLESLL